MVQKFGYPKILETPYLLYKTSTQTLCAIHSQYSQLQSAKVTYKVAISFTKVQLTTVIYSKTKLATE